MESLYPESKGEASPSANAIPCGFPEEDGDCTTGDACNRGRKDKHSTKCFAGGVDSGEDSKLENEDEAYEGKSIETDEEKRSPSVLMTPERRRKTSDD